MHGFQSTLKILHLTKLKQDVILDSHTPCNARVNSIVTEIELLLHLAQTHVCMIRFNFY